MPGAEHPLFLLEETFVGLDGTLGQVYAVSQLVQIPPSSGLIESDMSVVAQSQKLCRSTPPRPARTSSLMATFPFSASTPMPSGMGIPPDQYLHGWNKWEFMK